MIAGLHGMQRGSRPSFFIHRFADFVDEELALLKQTEKHLAKKYSFKIINHMVQYYGLCEKCIKKKEAQLLD